MKRLLLFLLFFLSLLHGEEITNYHVRIDVAQSGKLRIAEQITYDFGQTPRHGIYRDIPHTVKTDFLPKDIGLHDFEISMDGHEVPWEKSYLSTDAGDTIRLKIGDPNRTLTGTHTYLIRYRVKKGVLPHDDRHDAIRWNAVGTGWRVPISHIIVNLFLPPSLSKNNVRTATYTGRYGTTGTTATTVWMSSHHLQFSVPKLAPHEGLTVEVIYPAGTLAQSGLENVTTSFSDYAAGLLQWPALGAFLLYLYNFYRRHAAPHLNRSVAPMYTPPRGLDVLQSGLILDNVADTTDFPAAVLELAQKGYLDIFRKEQLTTFQKTNKSTGDLSEDEGYLLEHILFPNDNIFVLTPDNPSIAETIREGFTTINKMLYNWSVKAGYMKENPEKLRKTFLLKSLLFGIPLIALSIITSITTLGTATTLTLAMISIFVIAGLFIILTSQGLFRKIFGAVFAALPLFTVGEAFLPELGWKGLLFTPLPVISLGVLFVLLTYRHLGPLTPKGTHTYLHLKGLEEFIKRVKEDEIRRRLEEDPLYLDKLLPYALLFGLNKHWLSFYHTLGLTPAWYYGDMEDFDNLYHDLHSVSTPVSTDTGGMSGGGSFTGGGGGGGGGGSW